MRAHGLVCLTLCCSLLCSSLSGCMQSRELKERTIIETIGVDKKEDSFVVTLQKFSPELQGGSKDVSTGSQKTAVVQTTGKSISEAVDKVTHYHGNEVFLGNSSFIVVGKTAVEDGLEEVLGFFNSNHEISPEICVVMAENSAEEIINSQAKQGGVSPAVAKNMMQQGQKNGIMGRPTIRDVMNRLQSDNAEPYLPVMQVIQNGEEDVRLKISGMAVFKEGKFKDRLSVEETRGVLWATNEIEHAIIAVDYGEGKSASTASVDILRSKSKVKVTMEDGYPLIELTITSEGGVREVTRPGGGGAEIDDIKEIEKEVEMSIQRTVENTIEKVFYKDKSDVFRYSEFIKKYQPEFWKANEKNWDEIIGHCKFKYNVHCNIDRPGLEARHNQNSGTVEGEIGAVKG